MASFYVAGFVRRMAFAAMRPALYILLALGTALAAQSSLAYCVRNALTDRAVHAAVVPSRVARAPAKIFSESVAAGKEFCCNPKNADCNPDRAGDEGSVWFDAQVEPAPPAPTAPAPPAPPPPLKCGMPDPRAMGRVLVTAPVRGFLRFEQNTRFDPRKRAGADNPPYLLKALTADNRVVATYACAPHPL